MTHNPKPKNDEWHSERESEQLKIWVPKIVSTNKSQYINNTHRLVLALHLLMYYQMSDSIIVKTHICEKVNNRRAFCRLEYNIEFAIYEQNNTATEMSFIECIWMCTHTHLKHCTLYILEVKTSSSLSFLMLTYSNAFR